MLVLSFSGYIYSQEEVDSLTNSRILKMVRANLSDEVIIEEISISYPDFDISEDSIKYLSSEKVSEEVIKAMKSAFKDKKAISAVKEVTSLQENFIKEDTTLSGSSLKNDTIISELASEIQTDDTETPLDNKIILFMVNAKLSDEIIIKEINVSKVNFDISNDSINSLLSQNVSEQVISAMKSAVSKQLQISPEISAQNNSKKLFIYNDNDSIIDLLSFVVPLRVLIEFYESDFFKISAQLQKWNEEIKFTNNRLNEIDSMITEDKKLLFNYKIADLNCYTYDVTLQKGKLAQTRNILKQFNIDRLNEGKRIIEELRELYKNVVSESTLKYNEVSSAVRNKNCTPATWKNSFQTPLKVLNINTEKFEKIIFPASELLYFDQNGRKTLLEDIVYWNNEILLKIREYEELSKSLEQAESLLSVYLSDSQNYKSVLSKQKKKCSALRKSMNNVQTRMKEDSKNFSINIKQRGVNLRASLKQRYLEIEDCINNEYLGM